MSATVADILAKNFFKKTAGRARCFGLYLTLPEGREAILVRVLRIRSLDISTVQHVAKTYGAQRIPKLPYASKFGVAPVGNYGRPGTFDNHYGVVPVTL
jgi:hypothetical protein